MDDDARLIALAKAGNPQAFATLVEGHQRDVRAFVAARLGLLGPVDEIATEAFTRAWLGLGGLTQDESFGSWVKGIARLVIVERSRENGRVHPGGHDQTSPQPGAPSGRSHDERLLRAIDELPEALREIVVLRFFAGMSCAQAAGRLNVPVGTVTKRLSRAYAELRRSLGPSAASATPADADHPVKHQEITR